jgi:hypothetical protein
MALTPKKLTTEQIVTLLALREIAAAVYQDSFVNAVLIDGLIGTAEMLPYAMTLIIDQYKDIRRAPRLVPRYDA